eukprot:symbB.v1.2.008505.t2/scaffold527.1/size293072/3
MGMHGKAFLAFVGAKSAIPAVPGPTQSAAGSGGVASIPGQFDAGSDPTASSSSAGGGFSAGHNTLTAIMRAKASLAHQQWTRRHCLQTALLKTALVKTAKVRSQRATGSSCHPLEPGA